MALVGYLGEAGGGFRGARDHRDEHVTLAHVSDPPEALAVAVEPLVQ
jgi:hypothetical protein